MKGRGKKYKKEIVLILILSVLVFYLASLLDIYEHLYELIESHEQYQLDEFIVVGAYFVFAACFFAIKRMKQVKSLMV